VVIRFCLRSGSDTSVFFFACPPVYATISHYIVGFLEGCGGQKKWPERLLG
jgi:hypothetical protein